LRITQFCLAWDDFSQNTEKLLAALVRSLADKSRGLAHL
jgi:hypothetical protein